MPRSDRLRNGLHVGSGAPRAKPAVSLAQLNSCPDQMANHCPCFLKRLPAKYSSVGVRVHVAVALSNEALDGSMSRVDNALMHRRCAVALLITNTQRGELAPVNRFCKQGLSG